MGHPNVHSRRVFENFNKNAVQGTEEAKEITYAPHSRKSLLLSSNISKLSSLCRPIIHSHLDLVALKVMGLTHENHKVTRLHHEEKLPAAPSFIYKFGYVCNEVS